MTELTDLLPDRLASPWALLLLAAPLALWAARLARGADGRSAMTPIAFPFAVSGPVGTGSWRTAIRPLPAALRGLALVAVVIALARPQDVGGRRIEKTEGIAIQLVLDRSGSMREPTTLDGEPLRRIDAVKRVAIEFIEGNGAGLNGRDGDMVGVIAFGSYADTIAPPIRDHGPLPELIEGVRILPARSELETAIGDGLGLAVARLLEAQRLLDEAEAPRRAEPAFTIKSKIIVLLTDGDERGGRVSARQAAELAAEQGVTIYAIGLGTPGTPGGAGINEALLREIAQTTGGRSWSVASPETLRDVYATIDELEQTEITRDEYTRIDERFPPLVFAALALLGAEALLRGLVLRGIA